MFPGRFFAARMFAPRYFAKIGGGLVLPGHSFAIVGFRRRVATVRGRQRR